ncbi:arsenite efflux membrane protein ArsB [Williamsia limnetica]|uniref:Arsenite efflux membrane protein ArsB n=1 Tax=Williamsia limnetica TaxID=882452 RepID=A0A318RFI7_WILLI|nr:SLC13 family permease [Williamsia limnetica]PYE15397.1 arsenite efflux membrane protein ArsB [Williamsia limnetica]
MDVVSLLLLVAALAFAVWRPRGLPEATVAVPAALGVVALGVVDADRAWSEITALASTVLFLAALLVLSYACSVLGVFTWLAAVIARRASPGHESGSPGGDKRASGHRLLALVFGAAALTTAALSLDATVLLLTPVLLSMTRSLRVSARPYSYATVTLANSASTLMPVSNLTNLLAFAATGLGFVEFTLLMALPWLITLVVEFMVFCLCFCGDLRQRPHPDHIEDPGPAPRLPLMLLAITLVSFGLSSVIGIEPVWCAVVGAVVMAALALRARTSSPLRLALSAKPGFLLFVFALGVLVAGISDGGIGSGLADILPSGTGFYDLLIVAAISAVIANLINNIPAALLMLAALGSGAPAPLVLAMLLGVNIGPTLTYLGSLANLLWLKLVKLDGQKVTVREFTTVGMVTVPVTLVMSVVALWAVT